MIDQSGDTIKIKCDSKDCDEVLDTGAAHIDVARSFLRAAMWGELTLNDKPAHECPACQVKVKA